MNKLPILLIILLVSCSSPSSDPPGPSQDTVDSITMDTLPDTPNPDARSSDAEPDTPPDVPPPGPWQTAAPWESSNPLTCPPEIPEGEALLQLLDALGLDLTIGISKAVYEAYGGYILDDPTRLVLFHELQEDLTRIPCTAGGFALRMDAAVESDHPLASTLAEEAHALGVTVLHGGPWPAVSVETPLRDALQLVFDDAGEAWSPGDVAWDSVPPDVRAFAARLVLGARDAAAFRAEAMNWIAPGADLQAVFVKAPHSFVVSNLTGLNPDVPEDLVFFAQPSAGAQNLLSGGVRLAQAVDELPPDPPAGSDDDFELYIETPLGGVLLRGGADDTWDQDDDPRLAQPMLLTLDTGGDDVYRMPAGATVSAANPVALHVDLDGADSYGYIVVPDPDDIEGTLPSDAGGRWEGADGWGPLSFSSSPRQGAGILGYGFLVDRGGGEDVYRSLRFSQGFGAIGVGVLWDDGGDDDYECESACQGTAMAGLSLFYEQDGDDLYRAFFSAQGFASVAAYALHYDRGGNDSYELVPTEPFLYLWWLGFEHNISRGQGAATGMRRGDDHTVNVNLSGGVGMLRDYAGDDDYSASVMAQGNGYWFGFGIFADRAGNDRYNGINYVQGATEHFALAAFLEGGGDDTYNDASPINHSSVGLAHDFSVTFFVDEGGTDWYRGPDRGIGASKCHGLGVFVDTEGDDEYHPEHDKTIGWATDYDWAVGTCGDWTNVPSYGLFADLDGADLYDKPDPTGYGDDSLWINDDPDDPDAMELSGGVDLTGGVSFARAYGITWESSR